MRPDHFRVDYSINPFMDVADQPDRELACRQWQALVEALQAAGASVEVLPARADSPDMVFAMNLGLALRGGDGPRVILSHMRYPQRRPETPAASRWFAAAGYRPSYVGQAGVGAHFEAGDAFPFAGELLVGYGPRSDELALKQLAVDLEVGVRGVRIVHPAMYHLDLAFCPLDGTRALVCPEAFDAAGAAAVLDLVDRPIVLTVAEALTFCANSVVIGSTMLMPACPPRLRRLIEAAGLSVQTLDVSEFHKAGGSIRCLTNPLDIELERDLVHVPGGRVTLPG